MDENSDEDEAPQERQVIILTGCFNYAPASYTNYSLLTETRKTSNIVNNEN